MITYPISIALKRFSQSCFRLCNIPFCNNVLIFSLFNDGGLYKNQ